MSTEPIPETLSDLEGLVRREIDAYIYDVPEGSIGNAWTAEQVNTRLQQMRMAVVSPYWEDVEIRDTFEQIQGGPPVSRRCAVVADNRSGAVLLWDPLSQDFFLAERVAGTLISIGVRGDAVGCFLAI